MENLESLNTDTKVNFLLKNEKSNKNKRQLLKNIIKHILLIIVAITMVAPFFWMISTSLKTNANVFTIPPQWIPHPVEWKNYIKVFEEVPFLRFIGNSFYYTIAITAIQTIMSVVVAYGFVRYNFRGKKFLFLFLLSTMMLPSQVTLVPSYVLWAKVGQLTGIKFINTYIPLILPAIGGNAAEIFFMNQYFQSISKSFSEAAYMNGANSWKILWEIYVPMSIPAIMTILIQSFMGTWNSFLNPLIYLNDTNKFPIQVGLAMFQGMFKTDWAVMMAATTLSLIPMLILFFSLQKYFVGSNKQDGIK